MFKIGIYTFLLISQNLTLYSYALTKYLIITVIRHFRILHIVIFYKVQLLSCKHKETGIIIFQNQKENMNTFQPQIWYMEIIPFYKLQTNLLARGYINTHIQHSEYGNKKKYIIFGWSLETTSKSICKDIQVEQGSIQKQDEFMKKVIQMNYRQRTNCFITLRKGFFCFSTLSYIRNQIVNELNTLHHLTTYSLLPPDVLETQKV